jgi:hypothetical protein
MRATGTFTVTAFNPTSVAPETGIKTALAVGVAVIDKAFSGEVDGRSSTIFTSAFDQAKGVGTYVALESFDGSVAGRAGAFNFVHSASASGADRTGEFFAIVPSSGTGDLAAIAGHGGMDIDDDGTHRVWLEYELGA